MPTGSPALLAAGLLILTLPPGPRALAQDWRFEPRLEVDTVYSDNLQRAPQGEEDSGMAASVRPGFRLQRESRRLQLAFDYEMINLLFSDDRSSDVRHRADADAKLELLSDHLYIDAEGVFRQAQVNAITNLGDDLLSNPDGFADVYAFSVSPYWVDDFGGYADFIARYNHEQTHYETGAADTTADSFKLDVESSGSLLEWELDYFRERRQFDDGNDNDGGGSGELGDEHRERALGQVAYPLSDQWALATRAGYERNELNRIDDGEDGAFWSLGAIWRPSRRLEAAAFAGWNDNELRARWNPTSRTSLQVARRDRDVGVDTGVVWDALFSHRTRFTEWTAGYSEGTVSGGGLVLEDAFAPFSEDRPRLDAPDLNIETAPTISDSDLDKALGDRPTSLDTFSLTSRNFRRKRFQAGVVYARARTMVEMLGFYQTREFEDGADDETARGVNTRLLRRLGTRTNGVLEVDWEKLEASDNRDVALWSLQALVTYALARDFNVGLAYRYTESSSSESDREFQENRLGAVLRLNF